MGSRPREDPNTCGLKYLALLWFVRSSSCVRPGPVDPDEPTAEIRGGNLMVDPADKQ